MRKYVKTPTILQMEVTECGAASLCMVLASYGRHVPLERMRMETGVSRDGCSMKGIKAAAEKYGLEVHAYRRGVQRLRETEVPGIIHWNANHFVVFEGFRGRYACINDPAVGRRRLTMQELEAGYSGVVMILRKTERFQKSRHQHTERDFIRRRLAGQGGALLLALALGLALLLPVLLLPALLQTAIDGAQRGAWRGQPAGLLALMGAGLLLWVALGVFRSIVLSRLRARMTLYSGKGLFERLFRLPIGFFEQRYTGELVGRVMRNADVSRFLAEGLSEAALCAISSCACLAALLVRSPLMALIGLLRTGLCALTSFLGAEAVRGASMRVLISGGEVSGAVSAGLGSAATVKAAGMELEYSGRLMGCYERYAAARRELTLRRRGLDVLTTALNTIFDVMLLALSFFMTQGQMTPGAFAACCLRYGLLSASVNRLTGFFRKLQQVRASISRMLDIENQEQDASGGESDACRRMTGKLCGNVELREVTVGYSPLHPPVIERLSLSLCSGQMVALVGASGCGKSTIVKTLGGLYRPWSGEVLLDGVPRGQIPRTVLCNSVATVSQENHLFSGTIRDNLTLWDSTVLQADIERAAQDACIDDFIMRLPGGYDFHLEEAARNISGGERQRMEIARALARNPSILIMDEATSALDSLVEARIMDNIRRRGCTCILIAHRLSAIRCCTQIVVMKDGRIAERGTHTQLMRAGGEYAALMRARSGGDAVRKGVCAAC